MQAHHWYLEKLIKIPSTAKSIGKKPKRGRPQPTRRALVRQPEETTQVQQQVVVPATSSASHTDTQATTSGATHKKRMQSADTS